MPPEQRKGRSMVKLVGILNVTPDSFSDGGLYTDPQKAVKQAEQLFNEGADLVDIGAESTRPGAESLSPDEEWSRLEPVLEVLIKRYPHQLSLDTYHPETAERALELGDFIINDVTGFQSPKMTEVVRKFGARLIVSHLSALSTAEAHQGKLISEIEQVADWLKAKQGELVSRGIKPDNIIVDPGIGFGKTPELNWQLLDVAELLPSFDVMIGYSRKRFLGENRLNLEANLIAAERAIKHGATYLRVHDVAGHAQFIKDQSGKVDS